MSRLLDPDPGLLAIVAIIAAVALTSIWPIVAWTAYMVLLAVYGIGRNQGEWDAKHPTEKDRPGG